MSAADTNTPPACVLAEIWRYPVKSVAGRTLAEATIAPGEGLAGDRVWALSNGDAPVAADGAWTSCAAFERLTIRPDMAAWRCDGVARAAPVLIGPAGQALRFTPDGRPDGPAPPPFAADIRLRRASGGYWDHADGRISIVNLNTVEQIARVAGRPIDPLRFRANLYVRAAPWAEFAWLGRSLTFGDAALDVIRPIDRCRATSVRPGDGLIDINMPALLMRAFGHPYCGVYASVSAGGALRRGDRARLGAPVADAVLRASAAQGTAPPLSAWPRSAEVVDIVAEAEGVRSVWLRDPLGRLGARAAYQAGRHIRLHRLTADDDWRAYTLSAVADDRIRITVKRDRGPGSQAAHALARGDRITITGPSGALTIPDGAAPLRFWTAGIGITPAVAMLRDAALAADDRDVAIVHVAHKRSEAALWPEIETLMRRRKRSRARLWTTRDASGDAHGRPDLNRMASDAAETAAQIVLCGPSGFMAEAQAALRMARVSQDRIFAEVFASPNIDVAFRAPSHAGPIAVRFAASGVDAVWTEADGSLLDLAERCGLRAPSHCRAGLCGACRTPLRSGRVENLTGAPAQDGVALTCCSAPLDALILDL